MLTRIAPGVRVHESECIRSNAVIVDGVEGALLIDAGITRSEMADIARTLHDERTPIAVGFSTHPDWDHVLWHADLGSAPRYGTARCAASIRAVLALPDWEEQVAEGLPPEFADDIPMDMLGEITGLPDDADRVPWAGPAVRILEHRAHAPGHAALLIEDRRVLVAGDMLSDVLVPMLDPRGAEPIEDYLAALTLLDGIAEQVDVVVPGHGSIGRLDELRERIDRDRAYVLTLRDGTDSDDPRLRAPEQGWDWVRFIDEGQREMLAARRR
ncbi:MAG: MBL fold metallo-hydrolase [Microbacterium sp.]